MRIIKKIQLWIRKLFPKRQEKEELINSFHSYQDRKEYIKEICEQIIQAIKKQEESKLEYEIVTSYLTDIQKIDRLLLEDRKILNKVGHSIYQLTKERKDYQGHVKKLSNRQYRAIMLEEERMPKVIKQMKENERYKNALKRDMEHLEGEKGSLSYEKEGIENRQKYLSWLAKVTCIWIVAILIILLVVGRLKEINIQLPMLITISITFLFVAYILFGIQSNKKRLTMIMPRIAKAIRLLNIMKIKYVNNQNGLTYTYRKYLVHNSTQLEYNWNQYKEEKEKERKYQNNTSELDRHISELVEILEMNDVKDPDIWVHQVIALIDEKEMVEVRHSLNKRRQQLREDIEVQENLKDSGVNRLITLIEMIPESKEEIGNHLKTVGISF